MGEGYLGRYLDAGWGKSQWKIPDEDGLTRDTSSFCVDFRLSLAVDILESSSLSQACSCSFWFSLRLYSRRERRQVRELPYISVSAERGERQTSKVSGDESSSRRVRSRLSCSSQKHLRYSPITQMGLMRSGKKKKKKAHSQNK